MRALKSRWIIAAFFLALAAAALLSARDVIFFRGSVESVTFRNGDIVLSGVLVIPDGPAPHPAVVMVHGSGPSTHDETAYKIHANAFVRQGLAVLIYDKRGSGRSGGDLDRADYNDLATDVVAAVHWLRRRGDIKPDAVGLFGRSEGGWVAPLAASKLGDIAFLITSVGPAVSPFDQTLYQMEATLREHGFPAAEIAEVLALRKRIWEYYRRAVADRSFVYGAERRDIEAVLSAAKSKPWFEPAGLPAKLPEYDAKIYAALAATRYFDPLPILRRLNCPMLAIFGAEDRDTPTEASIRVLETLRQRENKDITIRVYPGVGHNLMTWTGFPTFYVPGYLDLIGTWAREKTR